LQYKHPEWSPGESQADSLSFPVVQVCNTSPWALMNAASCIVTDLPAGGKAQQCASRLVVVTSGRWRATNNRTCVQFNFDKATCNALL
jgi:hypothetical protein